MRKDFVDNKNFDIQEMTRDAFGEIYRLNNLRQIIEVIERANLFTKAEKNAKNLNNFKSANEEFVKNLEKTFSYI